MERNRDGREDGRREAKRAVDERSEASVLGMALRSEV
jgi:hypothetical protein